LTGSAQLGGSDEPLELLLAAYQFGGSGSIQASLCRLGAGLL